MRTVTITLGGVAYTINQLPMRAEAEWRKQLQARLEPLLPLMNGYQGLSFDGPADFAAFLRTLAPALLNAPDTMLEMLYAYAPELARQAETIETGSYSEEVMEAFFAVLPLAYPFGAALERLSAIGPRPARNGAAAALSPMTQTS